MPVIKHYRGVCHVFVDAADLKMAEEIVMNAKVQRPAVCNAAETLLVDEKVAGEFLPVIAQRLAAKHVELRTIPRRLVLVQSAIGNRQSAIKPATEQDWFTEYNDYILNVRVVRAWRRRLSTSTITVRRIRTASSRRMRRAPKILAEVDSATVYWNASTRFTDGGEFGMGAEIGISTDKIGAHGPMGLRN